MTCLWHKDVIVTFQAVIEAAMGSLQRKSRVTLGPYAFDPNTGELCSSTSRQVLLPKDGEVLCFLIERPDMLVKKEEILQAVWSDTTVNEGVLRACVKRIRQAFGDDFHNPTYIETTKGRGYRLLCRVEKEKAPDLPLDLPTPVGQHESPGMSQRVFEMKYAGIAEPFIDRTAEMQILRESLAKALEGDVTTVFIDGKTGMGKTMLVNAFLAAIEAPPHITVLCGQCTKIAESRETYFPILTALQKLNTIYDDQMFKTVLYKYAPMWLLQFHWLLNASERVNLALELQGVSQARMIRELSVLFTALAQTTPLVLILEDLHWADVETLAALSHLIHTVDRARLLIIGTCCPYERESDYFTAMYADMVAKHRCRKISLSALGKADIVQFLHELNGSMVNLRQMAAWLYRNTEGLPLFVNHLYRYAQAKGWFDYAGKDFHASLTRELAKRIIPNTLRQLIDCRINQLPETERSFLESVSVFGMSFNICYLANLDTVSELAAEQCAEDLTGGYGFLKRLGTTTFSDGKSGTEYAFSHAWFQKAVYERLPPQKRAFYHGLAGTCLERLFQANIEGHAPALAVHYEKAGKIQKALQYRSIAGQAAYHQFSAEEVVRQLNRGLQLLRALQEQQRNVVTEIELLLPLGSVLVATRGYAHPEVEQIYNRVHELCLHAEQTPQLLPALFGLCMYYMVKGEFEASRELQELFVRLAQEDEYRGALAWGYAMHCMVNWYQGDYLESCRFAGLGIDHYDPVAQQANCLTYGLDAGIVCLMHNALAQWILGYPERARNEMRKALDLSRQFGNPFMKSWTLCFAGWLESFFREYARAEKYADTSLTLSARHGIEYWNIHASILKGWAKTMSGKKLDETAEMNRCVEAYWATGARLTRGKFLFLLAECHIRNDDMQSALAKIEDALQTIEQFGERWWKAELLRLKGDLLLTPYNNGQNCSIDLISVAEGLYLEAIDISRAQSAKSLELRATIGLCNIWSKTGKKAQAREALGRLYDSFTEGRDTHDLQMAKMLLEA